MTLCLEKKKNWLIRFTSRTSSLRISSAFQEACIILLIPHMLSPLPSQVTYPRLSSITSNLQHILQLQQFQTATQSYAPDPHQTGEPQSSSNTSHNQILTKVQQISHDSFLIIAKTTNPTNKTSYSMKSNHTSHDDKHRQLHNINNISKPSTCDNIIRQINTQTFHSNDKA